MNIDNLTNLKHIIPFLSAKQCLSLIKANICSQTLISNLFETSENKAIKGNINKFIRIFEETNTDLKRNEAKDLFESQSEAKEAIKNKNFAFVLDNNWFSADLISKIINYNLNLTVPAGFTANNTFHLFKAANLVSLRYSANNIQELISIISNFSHSLTKIAVNVGFELNLEFFEAVCRCKSLKSLSIQSSYQANNAYLNKIYSINTLESLTLCIPSYNYTFINGIESLPKLKHLTLYNSDIQSVDIIRDMTHLETVSIIPASRTIDFYLAVSMVKQVKSIDLSGIGFNARRLHFPEESQISRLNLVNSGLTASNIRNIKKLPCLQSLFLTGNNIYGDSAKIIAECVNLKELILDSCNLSFELEKLHPLKNLKSLSLNSATTVLNLKVLTGMKLERLKLANCKLSFGDLAYLSEIQTLVKLDISNINLLEGLETLKKLSKLEYLTINSLNLQGIEHLIGDLSNLTELNMQSCSVNSLKLKDELIKLRKLKAIDLVNISFPRENMNALLAALNLEKINTSENIENHPELNFWNQLKPSTQLLINSQPQQKTIDMNITRIIN